MNNTLWKIVLILPIFISCQNKPNLEGNYYSCNDDKGDYFEVYFKKNLIRMASNNEWIKLSKWRKTEFINDTLIFDTFGEIRLPVKAIIKHLGTNGIKMEILRYHETIFLKRFNENPNFDKKEEFWNGFHNRKNKNCNK